MVGHAEFALHGNFDRLFQAVVPFRRYGNVSGALPVGFDRTVRTDRNDLVVGRGIGQVKIGNIPRRCRNRKGDLHVRIEGHLRRAVEIDDAVTAVRCRRENEFFGDGRRLRLSFDL